MYFILTQAIFILIGILAWTIQNKYKSISKNWLAFILKPTQLTVISYIVALLLNILIEELFIHNITYFVFMLGGLSYNFSYIVRDIINTRELDFSKYTIFEMTIKAIIPIFIFLTASLITLQIML
jgi:hypothetical protein